MRQLTTQPDVWLTTIRSSSQFESPFAGQGFVLLLHSDELHPTAAAQSQLAAQIVASGCRYACCSGVACSSWHDAIDLAFIATDPQVDPPDEHFLMTTWHERDTVADVVWFALNNTSFNDFVATRVLIVLFNPRPARIDEMVDAVLKERNGKGDPAR